MMVWKKRPHQKKFYQLHLWLWMFVGFQLQRKILSQGHQTLNQKCLYIATSEFLWS